MDHAACHLGRQGQRVAQTVSAAFEKADAAGHRVAQQRLQGKEQRALDQAMDEQLMLLRDQSPARHYGGARSAIRSA